MFQKHQLQQKYQNKIAFRYLSIATIFLIVIQAIISGVQSTLIYQRSRQQISTKIDRYANFLSINTRNPYLGRDINALQDLAIQANQDIDILYVVFTDRDRKILAADFDSSCIDTIKSEGNYLIEEIAFPDLAKIKQNLNLQETIQPVKIGDRIVGEIRLGYSLINLQKRIAILILFSFIYAILVGILFATLTLVIFNRQILNPLKTIEKVATEFASGNLKPRVKVVRNDEIGKLGNAINSMASQLQYSLSNLEKAMDAAIVSEKAKNQFLGRMSHEFKTPLNGIIGFTQVMQQDSHTTAEQRENLAIIQQSGLHLLELINNVLDLTRIESGQYNLNLSTFELDYFLYYLEQMFLVKAQQKKLDLIFNLEANLPQYIEADEEKLRKILVNLLENSLKFTSQGYIKLTIKHKLDRTDETKSNLYFKLEDTGKGIAAAEIDSLFVAFAHTERATKTIDGMGLGLPTSKKLIELLGGELKIESEINRGTTIRFSLPINEISITDLQDDGLFSWESPESDSLESQFFDNPTTSYDLTKDKLATMPIEWLRELQDATIKVDNELIFAVLEKISDHDRDLQKALADLIDNFRYDSILELTDMALATKQH